MSLKQEIETWVRALEHYDSNEFDAALRAFMTIADTSKMWFNCGVIHATLGEHAQAVQCYQRAVYFDQYLAIAYFQQGVSNFLLGDFEEALANFNDTLLYLRGNRWIDYDQLGLKFKLHSCEALFNRGLCYIYLQQKTAGLQDLFYASKEKAVPDHDVIDEAIREQAEGYTVFSIPVGTIYRPNEAKVKNIKSKNYLGTSRLIASHEPSNRMYMDSRRNLTASSFAIDDRPNEKLSYAAINLVKPGLASRSRQQSEPPIHRNMFPPTPPPEADRPASTHVAKRRSAESMSSQPTGMHQSRPSGSKPAKLDLGAAAFDHSTGSSSSSTEKPRPGTKRSASERPRARNPKLSGLEIPERARDTEQRYSEPRGVHEKSYLLQPDVYTSSPEEAPQMQEIGRLKPLSYHQRNKSGASASLRNQPVSIVEEDESYDEPNDSIMERRSSEHSHTPSPQSLHSQNFLPPDSTPAYNPNRSSSSGGGSSGGNILPYEITSTPSSHPPSQPQAPPIQKIRLKVFAPKDTRYILINPNTTYADFTEQIRKKFGFQTTMTTEEEGVGFKIKMRDEEGDMVTLGDEDDLGILVEGAREGARREGTELGKGEVWVFEG